MKSGYPSILTARTLLETESALRIAFPSLDSVSIFTIAREALMQISGAIVCVCDLRAGEVWATAEAGKGDDAFEALIDHADTYAQQWVIFKPQTGQAGTSLIWERHATCAGGIAFESAAVSAIDPNNKRSLWGLAGYIAGKLGLTDSVCFAFSQQTGDAFGQLLVCYTIDNFSALGLRGADDVTIQLDPTRGFQNLLVFEGGPT